MALGPSATFVPDCIPPRAAVSALEDIPVTAAGSGEKDAGRQKWVCDHLKTKEMEWDKSRYRGIVLSERVRVRVGSEL